MKIYLHSHDNTVVKPIVQLKSAELTEHNIILEAFSIEDAKKVFSSIRETIQVLNQAIENNDIYESLDIDTCYSYNINCELQEHVIYLSGDKKQILNILPPYIGCENCNQLVKELATTSADEAHVEKSSLP